MTWWIKVNGTLPDDPHIWRMARQLGDQLMAKTGCAQPFNNLLVTCVGAVIILWITADRHIDDQDVLPLGPADIDQLTGLQGFCDLMPAEWLQVIDPNHVKLPNFQAHNGPSAKRRAQGAKRAARLRVKRKRDVSQYQA